MLNRLSVSLGGAALLYRHGCARGTAEHAVVFALRVAALSSKAGSSPPGGSGNKDERLKGVCSRCKASLRFLVRGPSNAPSAQCPRCAQSQGARQDAPAAPARGDGQSVEAPSSADTELAKGVLFFSRLPPIRRSGQDTGRRAQDSITDDLFSDQEQIDVLRREAAMQKALEAKVRAETRRESAQLRAEREAVRTPPRPREIVEYLDHHVIGQAHAKRVLAVALYNHYIRLASAPANVDAEADPDMLPSDPEVNDSAQAGDSAPKKASPGIEYEKSNVMLVGPSGTGKTLLVQRLARLLRVPYAMADATTLTEAGYVGEDVDSLLKRLLEAAGGDVARAQRGIVFLDEVDKIGKRKVRTQGTRDVGGEGVQQALLKMMEGTVVPVDRPAAGRGGGLFGGMMAEKVQFDTRNLLFVFSGAFSGLEQIVRERLDRRSLGFTSAATESADGGQADMRAAVPLGPNPPSGARALSHAAAPGAVGPRPSCADSWQREATTTDLIAFGLIPEFVGRIPIIAPLEALDTAALVRALTEPQNSLIAQYTQLLARSGGPRRAGEDGTRLVFTPDALRAVAESAVREGTGARGLRAILERILLPIMYEAPDANWASVTVDRDSVLVGAPARTVSRS